MPLKVGSVRWSRQSLSLSLAAAAINNNNPNQSNQSAITSFLSQIKQGRTRAGDGTGRETGKRNLLLCPHYVITWVP